MQGGGSCGEERCGRCEEYKPSEAGHSGRLATINIVPEIKHQEKMIPVTESRARESCCFMRWSKSSWGFFRWISCSSYFISYRPFHSPCSCISRSPGSAERACGASPWQRWPPCWCPAPLLGQWHRCCPWRLCCQSSSTTTCWTSRQGRSKWSPTCFQYQNGEIQWKMQGRGNRIHSSGCGQIWQIVQGRGGGYHPSWGGTRRRGRRR